MNARKLYCELWAIVLRNLLIEINPYVEMDTVIYNQLVLSVDYRS